MVTYRGLAHTLQKQGALSFDESLSSISVILKAVAHFLTRQEITTLKIYLAPELRQLVVESRAPKLVTDADAHQIGTGVIEMVATSLELTTVEAKRRIELLLHELREGVSPWDDVAYPEVLERLSRAIDTVSLPARVA
jgi:hypothetical protein